MRRASERAFARAAMPSAAAAARRRCRRAPLDFVAADVRASAVVNFELTFGALARAISRRTWTRERARAGGRSLALPHARSTSSRLRAKRLEATHRRLQRRGGDDDGGSVCAACYEPCKRERPTERSRAPYGRRLDARAFDVKTFVCCLQPPTSLDGAQ